MLQSKSFENQGEKTSHIVTIGNFDGVHIGHQALLRATAKSAKEQNLPSLAITFDPHPSVIVQKSPQEDLVSLVTKEEKIALIKSCGIDKVLVLSFTKELAAMSPRAFFQEILQKALQTKALFVGYDFSMGRKREGDYTTLQALAASFGMGIARIEAVEWQGEPASSSRIRKALLEGDIEEANSMLGRPYRVSGLVVHGHARGRTIGFPTANLAEIEQCIPKGGVYMTKASFKDKAEHIHTAFALTNVGKNPTFGAENQVRVETFLIDTEADLYDKPLSVDFLQRIRDEKKFSSVDELVVQMNKDLAKAREFFALQENKRTIMNTVKKRPNILTIAGSDSGAGAGIQADIKTCMALGGYGLSAITALTAQNGLGVTGIHAPPPDFVALQIQTLLDGFPIAAAKTGMLFNSAIIEVVADILQKTDFPLVVDPVCVSQSGHALLEEEAIEALRTRILPLATLITPNAPEAALLADCPLDSFEDIPKVSQKLFDLGAKALLIKGGHMPVLEAKKLKDLGFETNNLADKALLQEKMCLDFFVLPNKKPVLLPQAFIDTKNNHGTGCTLSAAIACYLGHGKNLFDAIIAGQAFLHEALQKAYEAPGLGAGPPYM